MKIVKNVYFNIRITKNPKREEYYETISLESRDLSQVIAKALKSMGYEVSLCRYVTSENIAWKEIKI